MILTANLQSEYIVWVNLIWCFKAKKKVSNEIFYNLMLSQTVYCLCDYVMSLNSVGVSQITFRQWGDCWCAGWLLDSLLWCVASLEWIVPTLEELNKPKTNWSFLEPCSILLEVSFWRGGKFYSVNGRNVLPLFISWFHWNFFPQVCQTLPLTAYT